MQKKARKRKEEKGQTIKRPIHQSKLQKYITSQGILPVI